LGFVPKVMVRCLLLSTGERGRIIEALFARVKHEDAEHIFPVWGMDADNKLVRGGGLRVGKDGVVAWHHFVAPNNVSGFNFQPGGYEVQVLARVHGSTRYVKLWSRTPVVPEAAAPTSHDGSDQVWFDRLPELDSFEARRESRPRLSGKALAMRGRSSMEFDPRHDGSRWVAYFDLLGMRQAIRSNRHLGVFLAYQRAIERLKRDSVDHLRVQHTWFSDTFVLATADDSGPNLSEIEQMSRWFMFFLIEAQIPLRGALACGPMYADFDNRIFRGYTEVR
jgi:hypothetical protein